MENEYVFCDKSRSLREIIEEIDPFEELRLKERIVLAMLIGAASGDVSVNTMGMCLDKEQEIDFPLIEEDGRTVIDTEQVYNIVEYAASDVLDERYGGSDNE